MSIILFLIAMYWLPTIIAIARRTPSVLGIAFLNLFAIAIVPWWLALVWALAVHPAERVVIIEGRARYGNRERIHHALVGGKRAARPGRGTDPTDTDAHSCSAG